MRRRQSLRQPEQFLQEPHRTIPSNGGVQHTIVTIMMPKTMQPHRTLRFQALTRTQANWLR